MNILIDGRTWSVYAAGISSFLCGALPEWARQRTQDRFYVVLPKGMDHKTGITDLPPNISLLDYSQRFPKWFPNIIILQLLMPWLCRKLKIDLYYAPVPHLPLLIPSTTQTMVTVHDVVNIEMAETMSWTNRLATKLGFNRAIRKSDYLWTNSQYTKTKIDTYFSERHCQKIFVGNATDRNVFHVKSLTETEKQAIKKRFGIKNRFLLFVGSLEPRKNLPFLLSLMTKLYQEYHVQLVVVGGNRWKDETITRLVESPSFPKDSTIFTGYIDNSDLTDLYNCADCYVSTALMEGFGMPQLEALLCGCRVVTSHNTAMIELAQGKSGITTVEGYDAPKWQEAILKMIDEGEPVNQQQLAEYDWELIIHHLIEYINAPR